MLSRSEVVADAAVTVLARDGLRGLTHRAVDEEAGLPQGSTSNYFRSRSALIAAIVERLEHLDTELLTAVPVPDPLPTRALAGHLAALVEQMTTSGPNRATRARLALLLDDTAQPFIDAGHHRLLALLVGILTQTGHSDPERAGLAVADLLEGALVHAVTVRSRSLDTDALAAAVERLLQLDVD